MFVDTYVCTIRGYNSTYISFSVTSKYNIAFVIFNSSFQIYSETHFDVCMFVCDNDEEKQW